MMLMVRAKQSRCDTAKTEDDANLARTGAVAVLAGHGEWHAALPAMYPMSAAGQPPGINNRWSGTSSMATTTLLLKFLDAVLAAGKHRDRLAATK